MIIDLNPKFLGLFEEGTAVSRGKYYRGGGGGGGLRRTFLYIFLGGEPIYICHFVRQVSY